ncbi:MAG: arginine--tRNA ligase [Balneolaceae bacterium]
MNDYLIEQFASAAEKLGLKRADLPEIRIEKPRDASHGDAASNLAMVLRSQLGGNPREIAGKLLDGISWDPQRVASAEIAGPGFINIRFASDWLTKSLEQMIQKGDSIGKTRKREGERILVEFVSANPTGPLTVGHGRNAVLGDTVARLFEWTGADVDREYYFNNAGRQMRVLGQSVQARYRQQLGEEAELPEGGYEGEYIGEIASKLIEESGNSLRDSEDETPFRKRAEQEIFQEIQSTLERMGIRMDHYFNEHDLYEDGSIEKTVSDLREKGLVYDEDGAVWFRTTQFGKDKDTVLIKSSGEPTYRLPDIAYHCNKLNRGYDTCIDIFGADHIDTYPDVMNAVGALGLNADRVDVLVYQFVTIVKEGVPFKMSTRKANFVTLDELMDEVGADVTRFFFLMRSPSTHLEFDIARAKEDGEKNPVFYLQYAHARIQSILRNVQETHSLDDESDLSLLTHENELELIKRMLEFQGTIESAASSMEPHRLINYLNELASAFTSFYHDCRIIGEEPELTQVRAQLAATVARILANGLTILGIDAPDRM